MSSSFFEDLRKAHAPGEDHLGAEEAVRPPDSLPVRMLAFYLPQFHAIPENDAWWGTGFTEWTNVTRGLPRFPGHHQPILPADLGFYDLRLPGILARQAELAHRYGIEGFCFHHYWFAGKQLLQRPLEILLENPSIDLPFCLCWANESWTRRWDGLDSEVLMGQQHSPEDDVAFIRSLFPAFRDPRYIRVDGRPLLVMYRPQLLPNPVATARRWRVEMARAGLGEPLLVMARSFRQEDPRLVGFDAAVEFPPHNVGFGVSREIPVAPHQPGYEGTVLDYDDMVERSLAQATPPYLLFRGVCPRWDNEARKPGRGTAYSGATPARYQEWLTQACVKTIRERPPEHRLVFVNAWNEWAEGANLEPDRRYGHAYLSATAAALAEAAAATGKPVRTPRPFAAREEKGTPRLGLVVHDAHFHGAQMLALNLARHYARGRAQLRIALGLGGELEEAMRQAAPVRRIGQGFGDAEAWREEASRLAAEGVRSVLVNTVVSAQALPALQAEGLATVCLVHELPRIIEEYGLAGAARDLAQGADVVVFPNAAVQESFEAAFGAVAGRAVVMPQGLYQPVLAREKRAAARAALRARLGIGGDEFVVLGLGYGDRRKGLDLWPSILAELQALGRKARLVWVGALEPSVAAELRAAIDAQGLGSSLLLPGRTDAPQEFLAAADAFLLSSREDPFPSSALEAAAHGVPVLCFAGSGGFPAFVEETGLAPVPMADSRAMAGAVAALIDDTALCRRAGEAAEALVARRHDFGRYADRLAELALRAASPVTAVVPNYNYARYLEERIRSIAAQTRKVAEIIVLDDGSTDESWEVIGRLAEELDLPIRLHRNAENSGSVSRQWARGVEMARTPLVWIAEADDLAEPAFLERLLPALDEPGVVLAYAQSKQIDAEGRVTAPDYLDYVADLGAAAWKADYVRDGTEEISRALAVKNTIPNVSAVVFRRDTALEVLGRALPEMVALRNAADWLFYLRMAKAGRIAFRAAALNLHRRHAGGVTLAAANSAHLREIARMQAEAARLAPVDPAQRALGAGFLRHAGAFFGLPPQEAERMAAIAALADDAAWFEAVCETAEGRRPPHVPRAVLPGFPTPELQISTTGQAGRPTLKEALAFYQDCRDTFARHGAPLTARSRLVDFGVGWGRIGRFFLRDLDPANLVGIDVDPEFVGLCRDMFAEGRFLVCQPHPPVDLPDASVDFCVAYSVFSHLSQEATDGWVREFHRILKPGGMVAMTTRGRWFFEYCRSFADHPDTEGIGAYQAELGRLFPDVDEAMRRYDAGELIFATSVGTSGGGVRDTSFYGETFIPEAYARRAWLPGMELAEFQFHPERQTHPIIFLRKVGAGG
ncbi:glycosyltransferase [Roseococcus sp. SYP-B2431]|uniref:glycoside hydrolase family 99-like domain-containing protein n=1 Tax=Roseococcus sp. SYP-B2431 TaxID=2496640 RepID=UPI0010394DFA|nr:glycoside hydrolase family 99-like domain-containing protein [Roseococcus sp. SYP-B2431]TCH99677.1 glycosyltransferase [Roseococcus sp. SYP-B2431]